MRLAACVLFLLLSASRVQADSLPFALSDLEYPDWARRGSDQNRQNYCAEVLQDLRRKVGVQYHQPVYQATSIEDLNKFRINGKCNWSDFVSTVHFPARMSWEAIKDLTREERDALGQKWTMSTAFAVYKVNIDGNPNNRTDLILYGAGRKDESGNRADSSDFVVLNLRTCEPRYSVQVDDVVYFPDSKVGILQNRQQTFIFESKRYERENLYTLRLIKLYYVPKKKHSLSQTACTFSTTKTRP